MKNQKNWVTLNQWLFNSFKQFTMDQLSHTSILNHSHDSRTWQLQKSNIKFPLKFEKSENKTQNHIQTTNKNMINFSWNFILFYIKKIFIFFHLSTEQVKWQNWIKKHPSLNLYYYRLWKTKKREKSFVEYKRKFESIKIHNPYNPQSNRRRRGMLLIGF